MKENFLDFWSTTKGKVITIVSIVVIILLIIGAIVGGVAYNKHKKAENTSDTITDSSKQINKKPNNAANELLGKKDIKNKKDGERQHHKNGQDGSKSKSDKQPVDNKSGSKKVGDIYDDDLYKNFAGLDRANPNDVNQFAGTKDYKDVINDYATGSISIPSINTNLPIIEGTTNDHLWAGATTFRPNQTITKGNYTLLSHNTGYAGMLFSSLPNVKKGAKVNVTSYSDGHKRNQDYKVTEVKTVDHKDVDVMKDTKDRRLTLITCSEPNPTNKRTVVIAKPE